MIRRRNISIFICALATSLLATPTATAQGRHRLAQQPDTTAFFKGFAVSADLVGPILLATSDNGQYEGALRINLKDKYFPILELGYGKADHTDEVTHTSYNTKAPFWRVGVDFNLMKNKHDIYRLYGGVRYAHTSYKYEFFNPDVQDPVWGYRADYHASDVSCNYHWVEAVAGVDATIWGPIHLGWSVRYRKRIAYDEGDYGNSWYVPGYGKTGGTRLGGTFNVIIDI